MTKATSISIKDAFSGLKFLSKRTPETTDEEIKDAVATLSAYRDGVFLSRTTLAIVNGNVIRTEMKLFWSWRGKLR